MGTVSIKLFQRVAAPKATLLSWPAIQPKGTSCHMCQRAALCLQHLLPADMLTDSNLSCELGWQHSSGVCWCQSVDELAQGSTFYSNPLPFPLPLPLPAILLRSKQSLGILHTLHGCASHEFIKCYARGIFTCKVYIAL